MATEVTRILSAIEQGDPRAAEQLLPLVYNELRKLAAVMMAQERPGQTLQATALVHEAYLRLLKGAPDQNWNGRGHFFGFFGQFRGSLSGSRNGRRRLIRRIATSCRLISRHPAATVYRIFG